jgi:formylglycine-generating enzyme required for sulfatase activity
MRLIPAGMFQMGEARADDPGARPVHGVRLAAFCLDEAEVTAAAYGACVASTVCTAPGTGARCNGDASGRAQHPANCVGWEQARAFCHRRGADLPTESQWEYAARGRSDLGGNIAEWTLDWFAPYTGDAASYAVDPMGARTGDARVYRGGSWREAALADTRATHRGSGPPTLRSDGVGLRCARSPL